MVALSVPGANWIRWALPPLAGAGIVTVNEYVVASPRRGPIVIV